MQIQVTIQDGQIWLTIAGSKASECLEIEIEKHL
jgi:uncharacterized protein YaeQ